jgi:hypothetical protein
MEKRTSWEEAISYGFTESESKGDSDLLATVNAALQSVTDHLDGSVAINTYLESLAAELKVPLTEVKLYVSKRLGKIDKSDPIVNLVLMKNIMRPVFVFSRKRVATAISRCQDLTPSERLILESGFYLAEAIDMLMLKWYAKVVIPYQELDEMEKIAYQKTVGQELGEFDYTVFDIQPDELYGFKIDNRQTWGQAFPEEIGKIQKQLRQLDHDLWTMSGLQAKPYFPYIQALDKAYSCLEIDQLEQLWRNVDLAWIKISKDYRVLMVHGMENGYEHPYCVSPEGRWVVRDKQAQAMVDDVAISTVDYFRFFETFEGLEEGAGNNILALLKERLEKLDVSSFLPVIESGICLDFRYAGQVVPNRQDILATGGKIFLDPTSAADGAVIAIQNLDKHCAPDTAEKLKPFITPLSLMRSTAGHEYGHPIACSPETDLALGTDKNRLEESKATIGGLVVDALTCQSEENRLKIMATTIVRIIRMLDKTRMTNPSLAPYIRESLVLANILLAYRVIRITEAGIEMDIYAFIKDAWLRSYQDFISDIIESYQTGDTAKLKVMEEKYCDSNGREISKLINWINR